MYLNSENPSKSISSEDWDSKMADENTDFEVIENEDDRRVRVFRDLPTGETTSDETKVKISRNPQPPRKPIVPPSQPVAKQITTTTPRRTVIQPEKTDQEKLIDLRAATWSKYIIEDVNPLLVKTAQQFIGAPFEWMDGVVIMGKDAKGNDLKFWDPPLKERLALSNKDAHTLAKAVAQFSISPMGMVIAAWIKANSQLIAMGGALWVAGVYGYHLMQTKQQIDQIKSMIESQQKQMSEANNNHAQAEAA